MQGSLTSEPFDPWSHSELARVHIEAGRPDLAREHLRIALDVWNEADPDFKAVQETRDLLAQIQTSTW